MKKPRVTPHRFAKLLAALLEGPCNYDELVKASGLSYDTVSSFCSTLRASKPKVVHIAAWDLDDLGRRNRIVIGLGNKPDARRPAKFQTNKERMATRAQRRLQQQLTGTHHGLGICTEERASEARS